jgi:putative spermidine/putrescine transport system ATP-binding protein
LTAPYIELTNVVRSYDGRTRAVDGINLSVAKGEFITFLGPSGSGKTTTLMMLAGFEEPDAGRIMLAGNDITHVRSWKRNIGVVFQNYALFPHMTVRKNVAFPLEMRKVDAATIARKTTEALALVGLSDFADRYPTQLSGGQQQRVALARGLVFEPDVLLLDEPLGALDKNLREHMQVELKRIHREVGITMIYVTHDQSEAMTMSDRVVVFRGGKIEQAGKPIELYDRPRTRFVAEFVGDSNILDVKGVNQHEGWVENAAVGRIKAQHFNPSPSTEARYLLIRPEEIVPIADGAMPLANSVLLEIETIIQYGNESVLIGSVLNTNVALRVRVSARAGRNLPETGFIRVGWPATHGYVV